MSSDFTFTTGGESINSADEDTSSVAEYRDGIVTVELSSQLTSYINRLGSQRNKAFDGGTTHADFGDENVHQQGMGGEAGLHVAYDEYSLDEEIYDDRAGGDGGIDGFLRLDGSEHPVDVKTPTYAADPWLKVEAYQLEDSCEADAFVLATEDGSVVTYHGWISAERLRQEGEKRESRKRDATHENYVIEDTDKLNPMPPLTVASQTLLGRAASD